MSIARTKYKVTKSLLLIGILCTGLLSAFIGLVAFFGQYMGTFVISLDDNTSTLGITLSDSAGFDNPSSRLLVNPVNSSNPTTFGDIDFKKAIMTDGDMDSTSQNNYIAYTFYSRNEGSVAVDVALNLKAITSTNNVDSAIRIVIIEDGNVDEYGDITMRNGYIYMKDEENQDEVTYKTLDSLERAKHKALYDKLQVKGFRGEEVLGNYVVENFKPGDVRKYTLLIWLEGWDNDCDDRIIKGQLKMKLTFAINNVVDEEDQ